MIVDKFVIIHKIRRKEMFYLMMHIHKILHFASNGVINDYTFRISNGGFSTYF